MSDFVEVKLSCITFENISKSPVMILHSKEEHFFIPIWIGHYEAQVLYYQLRGEAFPRPLSHDLIVSIIKEADLKVTKLLITRLEESTYYAELFLQNSKQKEISMDCRPSDGVILALKTGAPILVSAEIIAASSQDDYFGNICNDELDFMRWLEMLNQDPDEIEH